MKTGRSWNQSLRVIIIMSKTDLKRPVRYERFALSATVSSFNLSKNISCNKLGKSKDVQGNSKFIITWILKNIDPERREKSYGSLEFMKH